MDRNVTYVVSEKVDVYIPSIISTAITMALGFIGNLMVIIVKLIRKDLRSNVAAYYITSLAISDLLISSTYAPSILIQLMHFNYWVLGPVLCKLIMFIRNLVICVSILTLTAIAFDRYQVICKPFHFISTTRRTRITVALIWIVGLGICLPNLFLVELKTFLKLGQTRMYICWRYDDSEKIFSRTYTILTVLILYIVPSVYMLLCYLSIFQHLTQNNHALPGSMAVPSRLMKERKKVAKMVTIILYDPMYCRIFVDFRSCPRRILFLLM